MIALNYNILQDYDTIAMTNEDGNYPIENIFHTMLTVYAQTTAQSTIITITFAADQTADMFAMAFSNLANTSTIVCVYRNAALGVLYTDNLVKTDFYIVKSYFTQLTTIRRIEITITNAVAAAFYFGTIWIGKRIYLSDIAAKHKKEYGDLAPISRSINNHVAGQIRGLSKTWFFKLPIIESDIILEIVYDYINNIGQMPHFLDIFENVDDNIYYCALTNDRISSIFQNEYEFKHRDIELTYKECL